MPIGIFDAGTDGLTVLDAIVNFDKFDNGNHSLLEDGDGHRDFQSEYFIYLADQANLPYGVYPGENKTDLLKEHIIKDVQFLLGNKYYSSQLDSIYQTDKAPVKAIVIACNTATAYAKTEIEKFLVKAGLDIKVISVIGAGVRDALGHFGEDEDGSIGIMATSGTVASGGYVNAINSQRATMKLTGNIAKELYQHLVEINLFNDKDLFNSEFYISLPNKLNSQIQVDSFGNFTYKHKYGRAVGCIQQYVKRVPFSKVSISSDIIQRLSEKIPLVFELIENFNQHNSKTIFLKIDEKI